MASKVTFKGSLIVIDGKVDYGKFNKWVIDGVTMSHAEIESKYGTQIEVKKQKVINKGLITEDKPLTKVNYQKLNVGRRKGYKMPETSKNAISQKLKGLNANGIYYVNGKPFNSSIDAAKEAKTTATTLRRWCLNGINGCSFKSKQ
jgi:hypothetical protein